MGKNSVRRNLADQRRLYTGEPPAAAVHAMPRQERRDGSSAWPASAPALALDTCTPEQRALRATLALFLLNSLAPREVIEPGDERILSRRDSSRLMWERVIASPRFDEFAIFSDMPGHLVQKVRNIPGIRKYEKRYEHNALVLRHVPTGGALSFRHVDWAQPSSRDRRYIMPAHFDGLPSDPDLDEREQVVVAAMPPMHADAEALLAGLTARLWLASRSEGWAVSGLVRDGRPRPYTRITPFLYLWGHEDQWVLRWGGWSSVAVVEVAHALTHPRIGIAGAEARKVSSSRYVVSLGRATLELEKPHVPTNWMHRFSGAE